MSRTTQSTGRRTLAVAGALLGASLAAPAAGHAQAVTSERTLLNHIAIPSIGTARYNSSLTALSDSDIARNDAGARALLGPTPTRNPELDRAPADSDTSTQVDGERALLGLWPRAETHRIPETEGEGDSR